MSGKEPPRAPVGRVQTGMASFCKPPPTAEQREQQHLEEGQKFKQQVQKQRADNQQRAAEAAKHKRKPCACKVMILELRKTRRQNQCQLMYNIQWMTEFSRTRLSLIFLVHLDKNYVNVLWNAPLSPLVRF